MGLRAEEVPSTGRGFQTDCGIDPENEVKGPKLLLLHIGLCLCIFLVGMVGIPIYYVAYLSLTAKRTGLQSDCNGNFGHYS